MMGMMVMFLACLLPPIGVGETGMLPARWRVVVLAAERRGGMDIPPRVPAGLMQMNLEGPPRRVSHLKAMKWWLSLHYPCCTTCVTHMSKCA